MIFSYKNVVHTEFVATRSSKYKKLKNHFFFSRTMTTMTKMIPITVVPIAIIQANWSHSLEANQRNQTERSMVSICKLINICNLILRRPFKIAVSFLFQQWAKIHTMQVCRLEFRNSIELFRWKSQTKIKTLLYQKECRLPTYNIQWSLPLVIHPIR